MSFTITLEKVRGSLEKYFDRSGYQWDNLKEQKEKILENFAATALWTVKDRMKRYNRENGANLPLPDVAHPGRAFLVTGDPGTGKTSLLKHFVEWWKEIIPPPLDVCGLGWSRMYLLAGRTALEAGTNGHDAHWLGVQSARAFFYASALFLVGNEKYEPTDVTEDDRNHMIIDDLGMELKRYGKEEIIPIIEQRNRAYQQFGSLTFITSNMTLKEISERYGEHIKDRILQQCDPICIQGKSNRRAMGLYCEDSPFIVTLG